MACKNVCRLCKHLVISTDVAFTGGNLVVTIPDNTFFDGEKVCLVVAQTIPAETTINAPVVIQIGDGTALYPLTTKWCGAVNACGIRTRTRYATKVITSSVGATFRLLGNHACMPNYNMDSINGTDPVEVNAGN